MFACVSCEACYPTRSELYNHRRLHQQRVCVRLADGSYKEIEADVDGSFACPCGESFPLARQMQRHTQGQCSQFQTVACRVVLNDTACDLVSTAHLKSFKLAVNIKHGVLICLPCGIVLSSLPNPLAKKPYYANKDDVARLEQEVISILESCNDGKN